MKMECIYSRQGWIYVVQKIQGIISEDNLRAKEEVKDFYAQVDESDNEAELTKNKIIEMDTKTYTLSIKS